MNRRAALLCVFVALLAGCGNPVHNHYSVKSTAECLRGLKYHVNTDTSTMGPIEASATEGALVAKERGNAVVITFSGDAAEAANIKRAYRLVTPKKIRPHLSDVMLSQKNAVLRWTITPPRPELDRVLACLK